MSKSFKASGFSRALSLTKTSLNLGKFALQQMKQNTPPTPEALIKQVQAMAKEMGLLKGSLMKAGQMLSSYGEHFLPKEALEILKSLQQNASPLPWAEIEPLIRFELKEKFDLLEIEKHAHASASIGQVHKAKRKDTGETLALKIQYPRLEKAIDLDLKFLKLFMTSLKYIPQIPDYEEVYEEIKDMMLQEIDYTKELFFAKEFYQKLSCDSRFLIPKPHEEFCTSKILAYQFIEGIRLDSPKVQNLSHDFRNKIGQAFFDLYLKELFDFQMMQTDPHYGNYLLQILDDENFKLVLFDFGAVRTIPDLFIKNYLKIIQGSLEKNKALVIEGGTGLGILHQEDSKSLQDDYFEICLLFIEPFQSETEPYDFSVSDLPKRVIGITRELVLRHGLRSPPREVIFLDRKLGGVYTALKQLKLKVQYRSLLQSAIQNKTNKK